MSGDGPDPRADALLLGAVRARRSPRAFAERPVGDEELLALFEAARWAPSSSNGQPWRFLLARRGDPDDPGGHARLLSCLKPGNRSWAHAAPVLALALVEPRFPEGDPRPHARFDLGLAVGQMGLQAAALDLQVHAMGGILPERIEELYALGAAGLEPVVALAVGAPGDPSSLPADLRAKEGRPRERRPLRESVFRGRIGEGFPF